MCMLRAQRRHRGEGEGRVQTTAIADVVRLLDGRHSVDEALQAYQDARAQRDAARRDGFSALGVPDDTACPAARLYHHLSSLSHSWTCPLDEEDVVALTLDCNYRRYSGAPVVTLPDPGAPVSMALGDVITRRRSTHDFADAPTTIDALSRLLHSACGVTHPDVVPPKR